MRQSTMQRNVADFGMDTISLAGPLEAKLAAVNALRARGVEFVESPTGVHTGTRGALTRADAGSPSFELVLDAR